MRTVWLRAILETLLVALVCVTSGCGLFGGQAGGHGGPPPVPVTLIPLEKTELAERIALIGESRSQADGTIKSLVPGVVSRLLVDVGDQVEIGQEVAALDGVEQRIALAEAEARLAEGQSRLDEYLNGTRPTVLRQRESELRAAQARLAEAEAGLKATRALSPRRLKQAEGDFRAAQARERNAADEYRRTQELVKRGALSSRELVRVQTAWDQAKGELLRAEQALSAQGTTNQRDEAAAVSAVEMARAEVARYQAQLAESREGPRTEVIAAQREVVEALKAARDRALVDFQRTFIKSPTGGTIKSRVAAVGDRLAEGDPVFELGGRQVEFYFDAPESVRGKVRAGQTVLLGDNGEVKGTVVAVAQAADTESRRQSLRVKAGSNQFLPGASVKGTLLIPVKGDYLVTHRDALVDKRGRWVVFTLSDENKAIEHTVDLVATVGEQAAIRSSELTPKNRIVGRGAPGLYPDAVAIPPAPETTPTPGATP